MLKALNREERIRLLRAALRCPVCRAAMRPDGEFRSVLCANGHNFDIARSGYINFISRLPKNPYGKELFAARRRIIAESGVFSALHGAVGLALGKFADLSRGLALLADLGCGEGSHLQKVLENPEAPFMAGVGLDISKEGIRMAAGRYPDHLWLVGDLANTPLADGSFQAILNILSPANYGEFRRMLSPGGIVIKAVPGPYYLGELREALFPAREKRNYRNDETVALFKSRFRLLDHIRVHDAVRLGLGGLHDLARMTPLAWRADRERLDAFLSREPREITVELDILIGSPER